MLNKRKIISARAARQKKMKGVIKKFNKWMVRANIRDLYVAKTMLNKTRRTMESLCSVFKKAHMGTDVVRFIVQ